jgi:hypothetical protein
MTWATLMAAYNLPFRSNPEGYAKKAALQTAISGLVFHDLEALNDLLDSLDLLSEVDYTEDSWDDLETAIAYPQTTNPLILAKIAVIEIAVSALVLAGMAALLIAIDEASALIESDYTSEAWIILSNALLLGETTNALVVAKTIAINNALSGLVFSGMADLIIAEAAAAALTETDWTPETWAIIVLSLELPETTNAEVVAKTTAINDAISGLSPLYPSIGEVYGGGKVIYVNQSNRYILIASTVNLASGSKVAWSPDTVTLGVNSQGTAIGTGRTNTDFIISHYGATTTSAKLCRDYTGGGYTDWFLPSTLELVEFYKNKSYFTSIENYYWSSTERSNAPTQALICEVGQTGGITGTEKTRTTNNWLRAFREVIL